MMEEDLLALILATPAVTALVGTRVSWGERDQGGALPAIVLHMAARPGAHTLDGPVRLIETRVQVDCWDLRLLAAKRVAAAVDARLDGFAGDLGATRFDGIFRDMARDLRDAGIGAGADASERYWRASIDYIVRHQERD